MAGALIAGQAPAGSTLAAAMHAGDADPILIHPSTRCPGGVQVDLTVHQVDSLVRVLTHEAIPQFGAGGPLAIRPRADAAQLALVESPLVSPRFFPMLRCHHLVWSANPADSSVRTHEGVASVR